MKYLLYIMIAVLLTGCGNNSNHSENKTTESPSTETHDSHSKTEHSGNDKKMDVGIKKTYPITQLKTETIDKTIKVLDNETIIYTEDTGHGIPTKPAGEGHTFHAILEATYKNMKMYMLEDQTFITADPKHVEVVKEGKSTNYYPAYTLHDEDKKYLESLNKNDAQYPAYEKALKKFAERQYDYKREMLMNTAIYAVNGRTPDSFSIPEESFDTFEQYKKKHA